MIVIHFGGIFRTEQKTSVNNYYLQLLLSVVNNEHQYMVKFAFDNSRIEKF